MIGDRLAVVFTTQPTRYASLIEMSAASDAHDFAAGIIATRDRLLSEHLEGATMIEQLAPLRDYPASRLLDMVINPSLSER